jgi:predicted ATP-grasp superfamily ATP-dependent carboligase
VAPLPTAASRAAGRGAILVTDAGRNSAIAIIRALGRRGWRVIAADSNPRSLGFRSRFAAETLVYAAPAQSPQACVTALLQAARTRDVALIIPVTDAVILPLSGARARFAGVAELALPSAEALAVVADKGRTLALAESLGVPAPRTCLVHTVAEALELGPALGWPLVLKPHASRLLRADGASEAFTVCYAENPSQLAAQMQRFEGRCAVLLQEYYRGTGHGVELLLDAGRPLALFQHKRLREVPIHGGASALRESVPLDPVMADYATRLLGALQWTGLAMVEFKVGPAGPRLMEINGRVWGSLPLAIMSGMDFPNRLADLYLGGRPPAGDSVHVPPRSADIIAPRRAPTGANCDAAGAGTPVADYKVGVKARNLELEMVWIASVLYGKRDYPFFPVPPRRQAVKALLDLFNPRVKYDVQSLADPEPGLVQLPQIARKLVRKVQAR